MKFSVFISLSSNKLLLNHKVKQSINTIPFFGSGSISNGAGAWIENFTSVANSFSSGRSYARPVMVAGENKMRVYQLSYTNPTMLTGWSIGQADNAAFLIGGIMVYMTD